MANLEMMSLNHVWSNNVILPENHDSDRNHVLKDDNKEESGEPNVPKLGIVLVGIVISCMGFVIWISARFRIIHWDIPMDTRIKMKVNYDYR